MPSVLQTRRQSETGPCPRAADGVSIATGRRGGKASTSSNIPVPFRRSRRPTSPLAVTDQRASIPALRGILGAWTGSHMTPCCVVVLVRPSPLTTSIAQASKSMNVSSYCRSRLAATTARTAASTMDEPTESMTTRGLVICNRGSASSGAIEATARRRSGSR